MVKFTFCDGLLSVPQVSPKWGTWGTFVKSPPKWGTFVVGNHEVEVEVQGSTVQNMMKLGSKHDEIGVKHDEIAIKAW